MDDDSRGGIIAHERVVFELVVAFFDARKNPFDHLKSIKTNMTFAYNRIFIMVTICIGTVALKCWATTVLSPPAVLPPSPAIAFSTTKLSLMTS